MRKLSLALLIFVLLASQGFAADPLDKALLNGDVWKAMGYLKEKERELIKKNYVRGYSDGTLFAIAYIGTLRATIKQLPKAYDKAVEGENDVNSYAVVCKSFLETTNGQLDKMINKVGEPLLLPTPLMVEGLDTFYADFKNRNIKILYAMHIVNKQIKGASEEEINAILEYLRGGMEDKSKLKYKDKVGTLQVAEFP